MGAQQSLQEEYLDALQRLNSIEQESIINSFKTAAQGKRKRIDRAAFTFLLQQYNIPEVSGNRLFEAFDQKRVRKFPKYQLITNGTRFNIYRLAILIWRNSFAG